MSRQNRFTCEAVYNRLSSEKEANNGQGRWWADCLQWDIGNAKGFKKENISVTYIQCKFIDSNGDWGRPIIDVFDEINQGSIAPITEEEAEQINLESSSKTIKVEARKDGKPYVRVKKYTIKPPTNEDGVTPKEGEPVPGPEHQSLLFKTIQLYNEAFTGEFKHFLDTGLIVLTGTKVPKDGPKVLKIKDIKIRAMIHDTISDEDDENPLAGCELANPSTRIQLKHDYRNDCFDDPNDKKTMLLARKTRILDYDTEDIAMLDGEPVKNSNVHKYIKFNCKFNAKIDLGSVCCSGAGISNPMVALAIAVKQPEVRESNYDAFGSLFANKPKQTQEDAPSGEGDDQTSDRDDTSEDEPEAKPPTDEESKLLEALAI
jgi:hypothetical protein